MSSIYSLIKYYLKVFEILYLFYYYKNEYVKKCVIVKIINKLTLYQFV